ncbi:MAG: outer membrane beta-barrel protein, partial [Tannerella sp.]|nr:outer membrane beta-barrel protein [Tannerella sp.]
AGGLFAEYGLDQTFSLRLGLEYSGQGGKRDGVQAMRTGTMMSALGSALGYELPPQLTSVLDEYIPAIFYADVKNTAKFDYLMIPLSLVAGTNLNESWRLYVGAGPFMSFLLSASQETQGNVKIYADAKREQTVWDAIPPIAQMAISGTVPELAGMMQYGVDFSGKTDIKNDLNTVNAGIQGNIGLSYRFDRHKIFFEVGGNYGFVELQKDKANGSNRTGSGTFMLGYAIDL